MGSDEHVWDPALRELDRVLRRHPEIDPPLPRPDRLHFIEQEEERKRRIRRERKAA
jgi:hypothetical protein